MPTIAFGTWKLGNGQGPIDQVEQALSVGFDHIGAFSALFNDAQCRELTEASARFHFCV